MSTRILAILLALAIAVIVWQNAAPRISHRDGVLTVRLSAEATPLAAAPTPVPSWMPNVRTRLDEPARRTSRQ